MWGAFVAKEHATPCNISPRFSTGRRFDRPADRRSSAGLTCSASSSRQHHHGQAHAHHRLVPPRARCRRAAAFRGVFCRPWLRPSSPRHLRHRPHLGRRAEFSVPRRLAPQPAGRDHGAAPGRSPRWRSRHRDRVPVPDDVHRAGADPADARRPAVAVYQDRPVNRSTLVRRHRSAAAKPRLPPRTAGRAGRAVRSGPSLEQRFRSACHAARASITWPPSARGNSSTAPWIAP